MGMKVRSHTTADFCADSTNETVSSQSDYYGAASRYVLILVRTNDPFV